jgi:hypothetical protein
LERRHDWEGPAPTRADHAPPIGLHVLGACQGRGCQCRIGDRGPSLRPGTLASGRSS